MSQAELFPAEPPAFGHGGYHPDSSHTYRGHQVPVAYLDQESMRVVRKPTLLWLLDDILDALYHGPVLRRDLQMSVATAVGPSAFGRHLNLLSNLELVRIDYRPDINGDMAVVELVEGSA